MTNPAVSHTSSLARYEPGPALPRLARYTSLADARQRISASVSHVFSQTDEPTCRFDLPMPPGHVSWEERNVSIA